MRPPRVPLAVLCLAAALSAAAAGIAAAVLLGPLPWTEAFGTVLLAALCGVASAAAVLLRRLDRRVARLQSDLAAHSSDTARRLEAGHAGNEAAAEAVRHLRAEQGRRFSRLAAHVTRQGRWDYHQQVVWWELREYLQVPPFMPPLRGWAASPDVVRLLVETIRDRRPGLVVECGSGASSVWLGHALRRAGSGRLVALEHDERYADLSRSLVAAHDLTGVVEIRHAPLREWRPREAPDPGTEPTGQPWYDPESVRDLTGIGLLFIDGPPGDTAPQARYPAGPVLLPRCAPDAVVVLDDASREEERTAGDRWLAEDPRLLRTSAAAEKGADVLTWEK